MLELKGLTYQVGDNGGQTDILRGIDLTIQDNAFVVITGPNGGGKDHPGQDHHGPGQAHRGTDPLERHRHHRPVHHGTGQAGHQLWVSAAPRFKGLKVRDLLELASGRQKLTRDQCCSYLNRVGLCAADYIDREVDTSLSGGEVKRIEIATILAAQRPADL